jgi:hypothetical protein
MCVVVGDNTLIVSRYCGIEGFEAGSEFRRRF